MEAKDVSCPSRLSAGWMVVLIAVAVVLFDQIVKIWVKNSFYLGEDLPIT